MHVSKRTGSCCCAAAIIIDGVADLPDCLAKDVKSHHLGTGYYSRCPVIATARAWITDLATYMRISLPS